MLKSRNAALVVAISRAFARRGRGDQPEKELATLTDVAHEPARKDENDLIAPEPPPALTTEDS